jgi:hypothetical protein
MTISPIVRIAAFAVLVSACASRTPGTTVLAVDSKSNAHVTLASEGAKVGAVWAVTGASGTDVYFAISPDRGEHFGHPVRVNDVAGEVTASGEQPPRIVLHGANVHVLWVAKHYGVSTIRVAESTDSGTTFSAAKTVTGSGINGARGWESATIGDDGSIHVAWLDGRAAVVTQGEHRHHGGPAPRQDVFHARIIGVQPVEETRVAANVCFCCKTAIVTRGADVFVAWRHLFDGGVRDVAVARSSDGGRTFGDPVRVSADNWKIEACPDDGPAMAFDARGALHVVWPTLVHDADKERMAVFHTVSTDGGATFAPRERVDGDRRTNASHPRLAARDDGSVAIVWDELSAGTRHVVTRLWRSASFADVRVIDGAQASSYPAVTATDTGYVGAWTEQAQNGSRIVVSRLY